MFWTISNSFASLAILSVSSLYVVRLWNPFQGGGVWGENQRWSGWVLWVPGAGKWPCHSGLLHPLPDPATCTFCEFPSQNFHCISAPHPQPPTISQLHVWFTDSDNGLPPPTPLLLHVASIRALAPGRLPFISDQTAVSSNQNMLIPLRRRKPPKSIKPNSHPQNVLN